METEAQVLLIEIAVRIRGPPTAFDSIHECGFRFGLVKTFDSFEDV